jgi:hypothetical protein
VLRAVAALISLAMLGIGVPGLIVAGRLHDAGARTAPLRVEPGVPTPLPAPSLFRDEVTLYGTDPAKLVGAGGTPAGLRTSDLGCSVTDAQGRRRPGAFFSTLFIGPAPAEVQGRTLAPLMRLTRFGRDARLTCTGPALDSLAPVYVVGVGQDLTVQRFMIGAVAIGITTFGLSGLAAALFWRRRR